MPDSNREQLAAMIKTARDTGKWLWCYYQDLWFSPDQLEKEHSKGRFLWGVVNWKLRDPHERIEEAQKQVRMAVDNLERIEKEIKATQSKTQPTPLD